MNFFNAIYELIDKSIVRNISSSEVEPDEEENGTFHLTLWNPTSRKLSRINS